MAKRKISRKARATPQSKKVSAGIVGKKNAPEGFVGAHHRKNKRSGKRRTKRG